MFFSSPVWLLILGVRLGGEGCFQTCTERGHHGGEVSLQGHTPQVPFVPTAHSAPDLQALQAKEVEGELGVEPVEDAGFLPLGPQAQG